MDKKAFVDDLINHLPGKPNRIMRQTIRTQLSDTGQLIKINSVLL